MDNRGSWRGIVRHNGIPKVVAIWSTWACAVGQSAACQAFNKGTVPVTAMHHARVPCTLPLCWKQLAMYKRLNTKATYCEQKPVR